MKNEDRYRASSVRRTYEAFLCTIIMGMLYRKEVTMRDFLRLSVVIIL